MAIDAAPLWRFLERRCGKYFPSTRRRGSRIFEADKAMCDALTASRVAQSSGSMNCTYGNGMINCY
jgi:hypothetical protein